MSQKIDVQVIEHEKGLLIAFSDDLPGLYAHGRSRDALDANILVAIKDILEAEGKQNVVVRKAEPDAFRQAGFRTSTVRYCADLPSAA